MSITRKFITAGSAIFTVKEPCGPHHTFKIEVKEANGSYPATWFVRFLSGPDNGSDYTYLGMLNAATGVVRTTRCSEHLADSFKLRLLNRVLARIWADDAEAFESKGYSVHHEGRCGRCGRRLTVPESIESGIGPECARIMGRNHESAETILRHVEKINGDLVRLPKQK